MAELITRWRKIRAAQRRIAGVAVRTGLYRVEPERLRAAGVGELLLELYIWKAESEQPIGRAFKLRRRLQPDCAASGGVELKRGVITYSSGNHAQGVAYGGAGAGGEGRDRDAGQCPGW